MKIELETKSIKEDKWVRSAIIRVEASRKFNLTMSMSSGKLYAIQYATSFTVSISLDNEYQILRGADSPYISAFFEHYNVKNYIQVCNLLMEYIPSGSMGYID